MSDIKQSLTPGPPIESIHVDALTIPTDGPEADGTAEWSSTTIVIVQVKAGDQTGLGYTYSQLGAVQIIQGVLSEIVLKQDPFALSLLWLKLRRGIRNFGPGGMAMMALSAVDAALWDLKARLLHVPLASLLGLTRREVPVYGSGGFLTYSMPRLAEQLGSWANEGLHFVKMKVGSDLALEQKRIALAREAIGPEVQLFIDANGALTPRQALEFCRTVCTDQRVSWFEEPVTSEDLAGLKFIRDHAAQPINIAAGEYGYDSVYFRRMLDNQSVDVLQADATRCGGISGFLQADALCSAFNRPLSAHTAPALHLAVGCAAQNLCHLEYFYDHVRIEKLIFDGYPELVNGCLRPDLSRAGNGLSLKQECVQRYAS